MTVAAILRAKGTHVATNLALLLADLGVTKTHARTRMFPTTTRARLLLLVQH